MRKLKTLVNVPNHQRQPMSQQQMETLSLLLSMRKHEKMVAGGQLEAELRKLFDPQLVESFPVQVMVKRLATTPAVLKYSPLVVVMTSVGLSDRVGTVVMWAYTLYDETSRFKEVTLDRFIELFPMGFPTEQGYHDIWDAQKGAAQDPPVQIDNMYDGIWN